MYIYHFTHKWLYLDKFLEEDLLGQMINNFVILIGIAKLPFTEVISIYTPTSMSTIFSSILPNGVYYQTF